MSRIDYIAVENVCVPADAGSINPYLIPFTVKTDGVEVYKGNTYVDCPYSRDALIVQLRAAYPTNVSDILYLNGIPIAQTGNGGGGTNNDTLVTVAALLLLYFLLKRRKINDRPGRV